MLGKRKTTTQTDSLLINDISIPINIILESRRHASIAIRQSITMRIPYQTTGSERQKLIHSLKMWAHDKLMSKPSLLKSLLPIEYKDGDSISILGQSYQIKIQYSDKKKSKCRIEDKQIIIYLSTMYSNDSIRTCLTKQLKKHFYPYLEKTIDELNDQYFQQQIMAITFRNNRSTWGSCSPSGRISIATRLLLTPLNVFRYVCLHECAHLIHPNHSKNFWNLINTIDPDYKQKVRWLKKYGANCQF